jgi:N-formylglutamate amidohydrolase
MRRRIAGCRVRLRQSRTMRQTDTHAQEIAESENVAAAPAVIGERNDAALDENRDAEEARR